MLLVCMFLHKQAACCNVAVASASALAPALASASASASTSASLLLCWLIAEIGVLYRA
jgi:hypothetical protein